MAGAEVSGSVSEPSTGPLGATLVLWTALGRRLDREATDRGPGRSSGSSNAAAAVRLPARWTRAVEDRVPCWREVDVDERWDDLVDGREDPPGTVVASGGRAGWFMVTAA